MCPRPGSSPKGDGGVKWREYPSTPIVSDRQLPPFDGVVFPDLHEGNDAPAKKGTLSLEALYAVTGQQWHPQVLQWFDALKSLPHTVDWTDSDWDHVTQTARLKQRATALDSPASLHSEIRIREAEYGVTNESRVKLRIRYTSDAQPVPLSSVSNLQAERRKRLTGS